jgi:hypothetical protein
MTIIRSPFIIKTMASLLLAIALAGCTSSKTKTFSFQEVAGPRFVLELTPGPYYKTTIGGFIFKMPIYPQVAAWVETLGGKFIGTIFVTHKASRNSWIQAPSAGRPEALPVWNSLRHGNPDSVSAATSSGKTIHSSGLAAKLPAGDYVIMLEVNRSYDYNASYTKTSSGVSGQPSIVYRAVLEVGRGPSRADFSPMGKGSVDGSDGKIIIGLEGIDTALSIFSGISIEYKE